VSAVWILRNVRRQVGAHPRLVLAAGAAFSLLTMVAGGTTLGTRAVARWGAFVGQNVHVIAYLDEDADQERAAGLADILRRAPTVTQVTIVEPATALARLGASAAAFGADAKALDGLEPAFFPRSIEISLAPAADLTLRAGDLAKRLRGAPGVAQVDAMSAGLARLSVWVKIGRTLGAAILVASGLVTFLALVAVFLRSRVAVATRSAVLTRLGETPALIRLPSGLWMAAAAVLGGGAGAIVVTQAGQPLLSRLESSLGIVSTLPSPLLGRAEVALGLGFVLLVGLAMGYLAAPVPRTDDHD
jgi:cell division protein FtsX